jgi:hypothetical protein
MTRRKLKWYEQPKYILTLIALFGAFCAGIVTLSEYIKLPETTQALAGEMQQTNERIMSVEQWIAVQQEANQIQRQWQEQQMQYYQQYQPVQSPPYQAPKPRCWDYWEDGYQYEVDCQTWEFL